VSALLNQRCVLALDIESMFRVEMLKILLQQYLPLATKVRRSKLARLFDQPVGECKEEQKTIKGAVEPRLRRRYRNKQDSES
jgi:hypothetical protein